MSTEIPDPGSLVLCPQPPTWCLEYRVLCIVLTTQLLSEHTVHPPQNKGMAQHAEHGLDPRTSRLEGHSGRELLVQPLGFV